MGGESAGRHPDGVSSKTRGFCTVTMLISAATPGTQRISHSMTTTTLRPMSTGQVLDRTFNLYRRNFVLFFGIAMLPPALMLLIQLLPLAVTPLAQAGSSFAAGLAVAAFAGMIVFFFVWLMGYAVAQAATVYAVSAVHLGRPITISQSYGKVRGRYLRILGLIFLIFLIGAGSAVLIVAAGSSVSIFA